MPSFSFFTTTYTDRFKAKRFQPYGRAAMRQEQPEMDALEDALQEGTNQVKIA